MRSAHDAEVRSAEVAALFKPQRIDNVEQSQHHYVLPQIVAELHVVQENKLESVFTSAVELRAIKYVGTCTHLKHNVARKSGRVERAEGELEWQSLRCEERRGLRTNSSNVIKVS